jgi:hypothetical protein
MDKYERVREPAPDPVTEEYLKGRQEAGWKLVAVEWARPLEPEAPSRIEVPYGWKVADDQRHLEEDAAEQQALLVMMDMIVADMPLSAVAAELNKLGMRMRNGAAWTPPAVFDLLPRLVESGPRLFATEAWATRQRTAAAR